MLYSFTKKGRLTVKKIEIYTDGACSGNPGPGGYGAVLLYGPHRKELSGGFAKTTNNRMEIFAAVAAFEALKEPCEAVLYSDSSYLLNALRKHWVVSWQRKNWIKSDKKPVLNRDLWERLLAAMDGHAVTYVWVKGHASNRENNRCDELARSGIAGKNLPADPGFNL